MSARGTASLAKRVETGERMNRDFFDAFPSLNVGDNLREWLEMTTVTKVTSNRERTKLCVHIICDRWIHKKYIYEL